MTDPAKTRRDLRWIRWAYRHFKRPVRRITEWAKERQRVRRFSSAQKWARQMQRAADTRKSALKWKGLRARYRRKVKWLVEHKVTASPASGVSVANREWNPYRKPVANWMIPWLDKSRQAGWRGVLVSGWRDPEYSEQLCLAMCGAPRCPGRCAGRASNHSGSSYPAGAVDVTDYYTFASVQRRIGSPLINRLGSADPVHFSVSGV